MSIIPDRPLFTPPVADLQAQLPAIGKGLAAAMETLARAPTMAAANQAAAQLAGAQAYVQRLREAITRQSAETAADASP